MGQGTQTQLYGITNAKASSEAEPKTLRQSKDNTRLWQMSSENSPN